MTCEPQITVYNDMYCTNRQLSMEKLTPRQEEVLSLIRSYLEETGYPPTRADIAKQFGFRSANAAEEHLKALAKKGAIEIIPGTSRGIKLANEYEGIPIIGNVAAGNPILAEENIEDYCELSPGFFKPHAHYLLKVHGDSMIECGILDGDLLAVHRTMEANNGDIVVARIEDEVTVKRLKKSGAKHCITLLPENSSYDPIKIDLRQQQFAIEGLAVGVLRH